MHPSLVQTSAKLAVLVSAVMLATLPGAADPVGPTFPSSALPSQGNTAYELSVSEDNQLFLALSDVTARVDGGRASPFATRTFSIVLPMNQADTARKLRLFLEGWVEQTGGAEVSLITTVNGEPHVLDFTTFQATRRGLESGCDGTGPGSAIATARDAATGGKVERRALEKPSDASNSFVQCIAVEAPASSNLRINVVLVVHAPANDSQGLVEVSSITGGLDGGKQAPR